MSVSALLLASKTSRRGRLPFAQTSSIERIWLYEMYKVRKLFKNKIVLGISMNLLPDKSRCFNAGYLFSEWFFKKPNDDSLLFLASIDSRVGIVPKDAGRDSRTFLLTIRYFSWERLAISSLSYLTWLSDRFNPFKFLL